MSQSITHQTITENGWAFLAADFFTRIDAYKADEERNMRECMGNRDNYTIEGIQNVIAYHQRHGNANGLRVAREILAERMAEQAEALLAAPSNQFTLTNTHDLKEGDIVLTHGMVVRIGAKQISDQGAHADNGYGCAHYHLSEILAATEGMPQPGTCLWNVQGNRLATWLKYTG